MFVWKCLHHGLPLGANLLKKHFNINGLCPFGRDTVEDEMHLFLSCPMTRAAWFASPLVYRSDSIHQVVFKDWISHTIQSGRNRDDPLLRQMLWFCWSIYTHRNDVLFKMIIPAPHQIIELWSKEMQKLNFFKHADQELHIFTTPAIKHRQNNSSNPGWKQNDILLGGKSYKTANKTVFVVFQLNSSTPHLLFYHCTLGRENVVLTFFEGFRRFLELSRDHRREAANLICQHNFNLKSSNVHVATILEDIHHMLNDKDNNWKLSNTRHDLKIKTLWPWIDSFIPGTFCFL